MTTSDTTPPVQSSKVKRAANSRWWQTVLHPVLQRIWYVYPGYTMTVKIPPAICLRVLGTVARPNMARLEHSNLFAAGRRYHLHHTRKGFAISTTTSVLWRYRARTSSIAMMRGEFEQEDAHTTRVILRGHIMPAYLITALGIPTFFASMVITMPWNIFWRILIIVALYSVSWVAHRFNAAIEAYHMAHLVQKALEAYIPEPPLPLAASSRHVVYGASQYSQRDFKDAWDNLQDHMDSS